MEEIEKIYNKTFRNNDIDIKYKIVATATSIIEKIYNERFYCGVNPISIGSAALYLSCKVNNCKVTQKEICNSASISRSSLANALIILREREPF